MKKQLEFAKHIAEKAGAIMLQHFQIGAAAHAKKDNSPITVADQTINSLVIAAVKQYLPGYAVIGEEESYHVDGAAYTWICDPIDGTLPYALGMPTSVFSLALVGKDGQPVVAVVHDPYLLRTYWASKNGGAFLNGAPIRVNKTAKLSAALVGGSGKSSTVVRAAEFKAAVSTACYRSIIVNSIIYEAMLVASGQIAATILTSAGNHNAVSAKLIIEEAGGKVTDVFGNEQ